MPSSPAPRLAPPGAGLPGPELLIARLLFRWKSATGNPTLFRDRFASERTAIAGVLAACPPELRGERVLIPRLPGLEDSSRYWSVWMTLDHLRITNQAFANVIASLSSGVVPPTAASTAAVKPSETSSTAVEGEYERSYDGVLTAAATANWDSPTRYPHPWFGPMTAPEWFSLAAGHLGIHRAQLGRIIAGLPLSPSPT
jgi:hypothetical protein